MAQSRSRLKLRTIVCVLADVVRFASSMLRPRAQLVPENVFLRKQLALCVERKTVSSRRHDSSWSRLSFGITGLNSAVKHICGLQESP
jgi:hypothetical protein